MIVTSEYLYEACRNRQKTGDMWRFLPTVARAAVYDNQQKTLLLASTSALRLILRSGLIGRRPHCRACVHGVPMFGH